MTTATLPEQTRPVQRDARIAAWYETHGADSPRRDPTVGLHPVLCERALATKNVSVFALWATLRSCMPHRKAGAVRQEVALEWLTWNRYMTRATFYRTLASGIELGFFRVIECVKGRVIFLAALPPKSSYKVSVRGPVPAGLGDKLTQMWAAALRTNNKQPAADASRPAGQKGGPGYGRQHPD